MLSDFRYFGISGLLTHPGCRRPNIPVYRTLEEFYKTDYADLTIICAPIHLHTQMVMTALGHSSNVLCEKPLCANADETIKMATEAGRNGKILAVG